MLKASPLKVKVFNSIHDVPRDTWNQLVQGRSCTLSHEFWQLVEQSGLNDFQYQHVLFLNECGEPVGASSFYTVTTDIAIFAPLNLRNSLAHIRRWFPGFLKFRMLECGTPVIINSPPFAVRQDVDSVWLMENLSMLLMNCARQQGVWLIILRDFDNQAEEFKAPIEKLGYHWLDLLPNNEMDIRWDSVEGYRTSLKSYYRSKLVKHLKRNAQRTVRHELIEDFGHLAEALCEQWLVVHHQADEFQREVLTPEFYRELSNEMGTRSSVLCFFAGNEWVGHALLLFDGDTLRWLYFGRKEAANDSLYFYCIHAVIETAINLGAKRLDLGVTTYSIKQDLGARVSPVNMAIRSPIRWINPFIGWGYRLLNKPAPVQNKSVFKQD